MTVRITPLILVLGFFVLGPQPAVRGDSLSLGKYVPEDVHFYGGWRSTKARARISEPYFKAVQKLIDSGIAKDIFDLATMEASEQERAQALAVARRVLGLLGTPKWNELVQDEVVLAFKVAMPFPEYLFAFKVPESEVTARFGEFRELVEGVAEFAPDALNARTTEGHGAQISRLTLGDAPFGLLVAAKGEMVALSTSGDLLERALDLMDADDAKGSIVGSARFQNALEGLDTSGNVDGEFYFDFAGYMNFFRGLLGFAKSQAAGDPNAEGALSIADTVIDELALLGTVAGVERIKGNTLVNDLRVSMTQKDGPGFIEKLIRDQGSLEGYARVVPKDAVGFYMTSGVKLATVYDAIEGLIRERLPEGENILRAWEGVQAHIGVHLRRDVLSWLEGGMGWVCLPRRTGGTETVFFLRTADDEKARATVKGVFTKLKHFLESRGQAIHFAELEGLEDFREIRIASLPFLRPVVGVPSGWIVFASSPRAVQRVAATFRGEAPSILDHPRYKALEVPAGHLVEIAHQDLEGALEGIANVVGTVGFVASILPRERDTRPVIKLGAILTKLSAFLHDIDVALDYGTWTRYDSEHHALFTREMTRVKLPRDKAKRRSL